MGTDGCRKHAPPQPTVPLERLKPIADLVEHQIAFGDNKAGLLLTADSILVAALVGAATSDWATGMWIVTQVISFVALVVLGGAVILGLRTILPFGPNLRRKDQGSVLNFASIRNFHCVDSYMLALAGTDETTNSLQRDYATNIYNKAAFARFKFITLYYAILATIASVLLVIAATVVEVLHRGLA